MLTSSINFKGYVPLKAPQKPNTESKTNIQTSGRNVTFESLNLLGLNNMAFLGAKENKKTGNLKLKGIYKDYNLNLRSEHKIPRKLFNQIRSEAARAIHTKPHWNNDKVNSWMVTAETRTFMKTGGLGDVAVDLPEAFNAELNKDGHKMTIVQPLYKSGDLVNLKKTGEGTYLYNSKPMGGKINLVDTGVKFEVPTGKDETTTVSVLKGTLNGTEYRFLQNDEFFGGLPNDGKKVSPYVVNDSGVGETNRFAFFSKATAYYMKELAEKSPEELPNVVDANDWHAGPLAAQLRFLMPAKASKNDGISLETSEKLADIPIVYTVHNLQYQGWEYPASNTLNLLYEGYTNNIFKASNAPHMTESLKEAGKKIDITKPLMVRDAYNAGMHGVSLADAVVPVSPNYANEVSSKKFFGYDFVDLLNARKENGSLMGIVNGIDQASIDPDGALAKKVYQDTFPEFKLYNRDMSSEDLIKVRAENKKALIKLIQSGELQDRLSIDSSDKGKLDFLKEEDIEKTPLIVSVTRMAGQKGIDLMAKAMKSALVNPVDKDQPLPIFILGGTGEDSAYIHKLKDQLPEKLSERIVFFDTFSPFNLTHIIQTAGDMFMIPSKFEPCGLTQLQSMAKGNIPVTTSTGGLSDTIYDGATGFLSKYDADTPGENIKQYNRTLKKAIHTFHTNPEKFNQMAISAMEQEFGWKESGSLDKYLSLFQSGNTNRHETKEAELVKFA